MPKRQYIVAAICAIVIATVPLAIGLLQGSAFSQANPHDGHGAGEQLTSGNPTEVGQSAFAAIQEIVAILEADPNTDWSKVNLSALREHLIDMDEVTLNAAVEERQVAGGLEMRVTGTGRTAQAIEQLVPNQAQELDQLNDWQASAAPLPNGVRLTVTSADAQQVARIRALGFTGLLVSGEHHQAHHLALAKGMQIHSMQMRSLNSN